MKSVVQSTVAYQCSFLVLTNAAQLCMMLNICGSWVKTIQKISVQCLQLFIKSEIILKLKRNIKKNNFGTLRTKIEAYLLQCSSGKNYFQFSYESIILSLRKKNPKVVQDLENTGISKTYNQESQEYHTDRLKIAPASPQWPRRWHWVLTGHPAKDNQTIFIRKPTDLFWYSNQFI